MSLDCWIRTCRIFVILCRTVRSACFRGVAHELMKGQGASMREQILDLIDFTRIDALLEGFNASTGFVTAILDLDGRILSRSGWRKICTDFHRVHPEPRCGVPEAIRYLRENSQKVNPITTTPVSMVWSMSLSRSSSEEITLPTCSPVSSSSKSPTVNPSCSRPERMGSIRLRI